MPTVLKLTDGRLVSIDISRLKVKQIRALRTELRSTSKEVINDPKILETQIAKLQAAPITHEALLEAYYAIAANTKPEDDREAKEIFSDKMTVAYCVWQKQSKADKSTYEDDKAMTYEEWQELSFADAMAISDMATEIAPTPESFLVSSTT